MPQYDQLLRSLPRRLLSRGLGLNQDQGVRPGRAAYAEPGLGIDTNLAMEAKRMADEALTSNQDEAQNQQTPSPQFTTPDTSNLSNAVSGLTGSGGGESKGVDSRRLGYALGAALYGAANPMGSRPAFPAFREDPQSKINTKLNALRAEYGLKEEFAEKERNRLEQAAEPIANGYGLGPEESQTFKQLYRDDPAAGIEYAEGRRAQRQAQERINRRLGGQAGGQVGGGTAGGTLDAETGDLTAPSAPSSSKGLVSGSVGWRETRAREIEMEAQDAYAEVISSGGKTADAEKILADARSRADKMRTDRTPLQQEMDKKFVTKFYKRQEAAELAVNSLRSSAEARKIINEGINTGVLANFKTGVGRMLIAAGFDNGMTDDAERTEAYVSSRVKEVGTIIKLFGSGTGLSNADREYAERAAAGKVEMTEGAIRRLLDISERAARNVITNYNRMAEPLDASGDFQYTKFSLDYVPDQYETGYYTKGGPKNSGFGRYQGMTKDELLQNNPFANGFGG